MKKCFDFEQYLQKEFKNERKNSFTNKKQNNTADIFPETISNYIDELKEIINKNISMFSLIKNTEPLHCDSVLALIDKTNTPFNIRNFYKKLSEIDEIKCISELYIDAYTNERKDLSENILNGTKEKTVCIRNNYTYIKSTQVNEKQSRTEYEFNTFCPRYTGFIIDNGNSIFAGNLTFIKFNSLVDSAKQVHDTINGEKLSDDLKLQQKILFAYLIERGCAINYKFFMYKYAQTFHQELKSLKVDKDNFSFLMKEYLLYFTKFRDVFMFSDENFFGALHKIVSELLKIRNQYLLETKTNFDSNIFYQICQGKTNEILECLFNYQTNLYRESANDSFHVSLENYELSFKTIFENAHNRTSYDVELWNQVQNYANIHIDTDFDKTFFSLLPKFNGNQFESKIAFDSYIKSQNLYVK